jgi:hypothetical protein
MKRVAELRSTQEVLDRAVGEQLARNAGDHCSGSIEYVQVLQAFGQLVQTHWGLLS